jgi:hypothetical protein
MAKITSHAKAVDYLITVWNDRLAKWMSMRFSPPIGAAIKAGYWFPVRALSACRTKSLYSIQPDATSL